MNEPLRSVRPNGKSAKLTRALTGQFSRWRKGEKVIAWRDEDRTYTIERAKWKGSLVPLMNQLCRVPRKALEFA